MSIFFKPLGYLTAFAASVGGAACGPEVSGQAASAMLRPATAAPTTCTLQCRRSHEKTSTQVRTIN